MAQIKISQLTTGVPKGTDLTPATDTTDTTQAASGTTKKYVRSDELNFYLAAQGLVTYSATRVATTVPLTVTYANGVLGVGATLTNAGAQAALSIDGVALAVSDRVLVKNQAAPAQNGIYTVTSIGSGATNWVMTRATDYDQAAEVVQYGVVLSDQGTTNAGILWQETGAGPWTIGTTAIVFAAFTSQSTSVPVLLSQGGTSASLVADNGGIFYSTATAGAILAGTAIANRVLLSGASSAPSWSTAVYPATTTINQLLYSSAGDLIAGLATANNGLLVTGNTGVPSILAGPGTTGNIIRSNAAAAPSFSTATFADTYAVSTLLYASASNAVTGLATANNASLSTNATGVPTWLALTDGQLVIGSSAGAPLAATLTAGVGITITNAANSITINSDNSGLAWSGIAGTTQAAAVDSGYVVQNAATTTITLPAVFGIGDTIIIKGLGAGGWILTAAGGDIVHVGQVATSAGGTVTSANNYDVIQVSGLVANAEWSMDYSVTSGFSIV